jgi:hypothetical protein
MSVVKRTYSIFLHTLLLAVYAIFLSVQVFFNFESFTHLQNLAGYPILSNTHRIEPTVTAKKPGNTASKTAIRLNKRFQQEEMPPCDIVSVPAPVQYITLRSLGHYKNVLRLFIFPISQPLRGPPFEA